MRLGKLYLITTPIGNLGDISYRVEETLKEVPIILAEDTRKIQNLLNHLKIKDKKLISYFEGNHWERIPRAIKSLKQGKNIGLVTDAGAPLIADPGYQLVKSVLNQGLSVVPIPGPSAVITALMGAGLPCDKFSFLGYLPKKNSKKSKLFKTLKRESLIKTIVFYDSPERLLPTLKLLKTELGDFKISICREMTKKYEEFIRGDISQVIKELEKKEIKGEITVVVYLD